MEATQLYEIICDGYLTPPERLYGFPVKDLDNPGRRLGDRDHFGRLQIFTDQLEGTYDCERCEKEYKINANGIPTGPCRFHTGNSKLHSGQTCYDCCWKPTPSEGCTTRKFHLNRHELHVFHYDGYVETQNKPHLNPNKHGLFGVDCEMVQTIFGMELARVSVVDHNMDVVYDKLVKPQNRVLDYLTDVTGITKQDLNLKSVADLKQVQTDLLNLFSSESVLVGHSIEHDMKALKLFHTKFADTSILYLDCSSSRRKVGLATLIKTLLDHDIHKRFHDSIIDARASMLLLLLKAKQL